DEGFLASIRDNGQQVPILVRPHPTQSGRYQTAYGHRRIAAAGALGRRVRAIIKPLTDEELVVAQGQENIERNGLSFIEKCRFAHALERRSFTRETIGQALSAHKTILSIMLSLIERLPADLIDAIGPAPATGRRAWSVLADQLDQPSTLEKIRTFVNSEVFATANTSDEKFRAILAATSDVKRTAPRKEIWSRAGRNFGSLAVGEKKITLSIDLTHNPEFEALVLERLSALKAELSPEKPPKEDDL
ncbi:MAG TPA: plasmid partitioning protein RepB, partial [Methylocella sp.]|nr:plasmid partitioning protein RepB [Methylocella sp.]